MNASERIWRERALREAVLAGDEAAWRALYDQCYGAVFAFVRCRTDDAAVAEEIVQECWMVAVRKIRRFDPASSAFETWLVGIARNLLRNHRRKVARRRKSEAGSVSSDELSEQVASGAEDRHDLRASIAMALSSLSSRYQTVLLAKYAENRSVAAIAASTGQSPKAVESLLTRARTAFRESYRRLAGDESENEA